MLIIAVQNSYASFTITAQNFLWTSCQWYCERVLEEQCLLYQALSLWWGCPPSLQPTSSPESRRGLWNFQRGQCDSSILDLREKNNISHHERTWRCQQEYHRMWALQRRGLVQLRSRQPTSTWWVGCNRDTKASKAITMWTTKISKKKHTPNTGLETSLITHINWFKLFSNPWIFFEELIFIFPLLQGPKCASTRTQQTTKYRGQCYPPSLNPLN